MTNAAAAKKRLGSRSILALVFFLAMIALVAVSPAGAQGDEPVPEAPAATDEVLTLGAEVYGASCASCHQAGGTGLPGQFPPLLDNPNVDDAAYVQEVIENGRSGELVVNGETYDNVMPPVSGLAEEDTTALIAYLQSGFTTPTGEEGAVAADPAASLADGALPGMVNIMIAVAMLVGLVVAGIVLWPRMAAAHSRLDTTWLDSWMKTGVIVVVIVVATILVPNWIMNLSSFSELDPTVQDLLATTIWGVALGGCLWSLWYAHGKKWI